MPLPVWGSKKWSARVSTTAFTSSPGVIRDRVDALDTPARIAAQLVRTPPVPVQKLAADGTAARC